MALDGSSFRKEQVKKLGNTSESEDVIKTEQSKKEYETDLYANPKMPMKI